MTTMAPTFITNKMVQVTRIDADVAVNITRNLYAENSEIKRRICYGVDLQSVWIIVPRLNHRLIQKKKDEEFRRLCWRLRSYYNPTLKFRLLP